jgi:hypothetical protein
MIEAFRREALAWAAGGRGKPLVDALAEGLDSPSLRMLAGATAVAADEEADEWAARTFGELGLEVHDRFSREAIIDFARLRAWEFLQSRGTISEESPRAPQSFTPTRLRLATPMNWRPGRVSMITLSCSSLA